MATKNSSLIYWTLLQLHGWSLFVAATALGLCYVGSPNKPFEELRTWAKRSFPDRSLVQDDEKLQSYVLELMEYFEGNRKEFSVPFDYHGTPFQVSVWNALCEIPYGETRSYSDIANHIQRPSSVRAVGAAIGANPVLITVPCHRVIGKNGALTGYRGGLEMKTKLLSLEQTSSY